MDVAAASPPDLLAATVPLGRGPPAAARPPGQRDPGGSPTVAPFDLLFQLLASAMPTGQSLPAGGSALPTAADPSSCAAPSGAASSTVPGAPSAPSASSAAQTGSTDLADWLRLALAGAAAPAGSATPTTLDAAATGDALSSVADPATAPPSTPAALAPGRASADSAPIDLQALLGTASAPTTPSPELAALANLPSPRAAADTSRRTASNVAPVDGTTQPTASDLAQTDASALHAGLPPPVVVTEAIAATAKSARPDDALPLVVTAAAGADAASAPALPLMHPATATHATAASAASAQTGLPQSSGDPIDTNAARWHDALATRIQWLVDHDIGEAKIKLNPPELGALDVKIALQDDKTYVQMTAHSASARDELAQGLPRLRELLSAGGLELGGATVSNGSDNRASYGSAAPQPIARVTQFAAAADVPDAPSVRRGASAAVIDTFA
jgi:flagellar hook-length control protein FliK